MQENENVFTGRTVEEATEEGLKALGVTIADVNIEIIEEGKKKLFGSVKAKVKLTLVKDDAKSDAKRAADFVDGLMKILEIPAESEILSEGDSISINVKTTATARVIGKRGDVLDAIQNMAGAVANIGRDDYKKVVVDCENYRSQREDTLKALAAKLAKKAVESGRKLILEPMNPYERRIIHAALMDNAEVKTASEGKEPARYIVVIPNNAKPYDKGIRFGGRDDRRGGRNGRDDRRGGRKDFRGGRDDRRGGRGGRDGSPRPSGGAKRGKKEIYFGTFLGNSGAGKAAGEQEEKKDEE